MGSHDAARAPWREVPSYDDHQLAAVLVRWAVLWTGQPAYESGGLVFGLRAAVARL
jgi:hypothetical protein